MPDKQHQIPRGPFSSTFETLKSWLENQPHAVIWRVVALGMACVFTLDFFMAPFGVQSGLFYLLPICLACWRISYRAGLFLGFMASILAAALGLLVTKVPLNSNLGTMVMNASALSVLGVIVESFRNSVERERFLASLDHMTRALTKKAFEQRAEAMLAEAAAQGRPLLLAYLDLDGFKAINDRHGHEVGDELLKRFASAALTALRREDCFGRLGGDEFVVLMPLSSPDAAQAMASGLHERLRATLEDTVEVTCSMGALIVPPAGRRSLKELLREADRVMYAVKRSGKDGLRFATAAPPLDPDTILLPGAVGKEAADLMTQKLSKAV